MRGRLSIIDLFLANRLRTSALSHSRRKHSGVLDILCVLLNHEVPEYTLALSIPNPLNLFLRHPRLKAILFLVGTA